jgi:7-carboxy-7-deazaguanine synthase (Cx14CxxC type)
VPRAYTVKEIFYTLQGEGALAGTPAVFLRFAGCNLWSGREEDRADAVCNFCDTDFVGTGPDGGKFTGDGLAHEVRSRSADAVWVVCTGGEPLLQLDTELIQCLKKSGFKVAIETNGTIEAPSGIDWICVSPKAGAEFIQRTGDELKLVFPQEGLQPSTLPNDLSFEHYFLQPMDGPNLEGNTKAAIAYCLDQPQRRQSLQTHKLLGQS